MIVLGITGAIASGKSTVAAMFAEAGLPVFSADEAVHGYYRDAPAAVAEIFPTAVVDGAVDRRHLAEIVASDPEAIDRLEAIIHPVVRAATERFLDDARRAGAGVAVIEIPLLFEAGYDAQCDRILVTTALPATREARVAERGTMPSAVYRRLVGRQMDEAEKLGRADYVVDTDDDLAAVRSRIGDIIGELKAASG